MVVKIEGLTANNDADVARRAAKMAWDELGGAGHMRYRLHQMLIRSGLPDLAPLISSVRYVNPDDE